MEEGDVAWVPIFREPRRRVPQEEGSGVSLLARGVDLLQINSVRIQDGGVVSAKRVRLWLGKIRTVRADGRRQIRMA